MLAQDIHAYLHSKSRIMHIYLTPFIFLYAAFLFLLANTYDGPLYDSSAYTECKAYPEDPLYKGGILQEVITVDAAAQPTIMLHNLSIAFYTFSAWIMIEDEGDYNGKSTSISVASASLQPFTEEQWRLNQQAIINKERKRFVTVHVSDMHGERLVGASITVQQISKDFPFGSAIASTILGNLPYQNWFLKRFNAAVFENELKWYATEPKQGKTNYTLADKMLEFVRANQITTRGHNIFWEAPNYTPSWVTKLDGFKLQQAVNSRITSLMSRFREEFIHWDVSNEMLHYNFYEQRLGPNATLGFFKIAHRADPLATLFMNEFNVVETCNDVSSTVDDYIQRLRGLQRGGVTMDGIGLEAHFTVPNPPLIRGILDKLGTLGLPIWLTEVDISHNIDKPTQAVYLEQVLREGFSHPTVKGLMLWTALHPEGCYQMCLTNTDFRNLPAGDMVDKLLEEWQTKNIQGVTDQLGSFSFHGFLGEYNIVVKYQNRITNLSFSLTGGHETRFLNIQL
ncbi:Anti-sigma-I factor RsgI6 [Bienertia sinuspersici]